MDATHSAAKELSSVRGVARKFGCSRSAVTTAMLVMGVIPRPVGRSLAIRDVDIELLRPLLEKSEEAAVPA